MTEDPFESPRRSPRASWSSYIMMALAGVLGGAALAHDGPLLRGIVEQMSRVFGTSAFGEPSAESRASPKPPERAVAADVTRAITAPWPPERLMPGRPSSGR